MKIIHISAECYPLAKVGGLADVVGALPKYQNELDHETSVIMPHYNIKGFKQYTFELVFSSDFRLGERQYAFKILKLKDDVLGFPIYVVDIPEFLYKDYVYSDDDSDRFLAFGIAVLNWIHSLKNKPTIVHCHDHHTGLIPFMMSYCFDYESLRDIPTILTIHNAQYQGWFSHEKINQIPAFDKKHTGLLDWDDSINPLAAAIKCAWKVTTVSPSYMEELKSNANGLEALLRLEHDKCIGILNGIDLSVWDPKTDELLVRKYQASQIQSGKKANKNWLCKEFNLDPDQPLFAFIGRLVYEKGSDLFPETFNDVLKNGNLSFLVLGSGEKNAENSLVDLKTGFQNNFNAYIGYSETLAHIIYAGADFLLMPSRVEPCGLNQMYAMRYGTIPIVREIGGLKDTVIDINYKGFGITHKDASVNDIKEAIGRAIKLYEDQSDFRKIRKRIMSIDHSWERSASEYLNVYKSVT